MANEFPSAVVYPRTEEDVQAGRRIALVRTDEAVVDEWGREVGAYTVYSQGSVVGPTDGIIWETG